MRLAWFTPLDPERSGIATYSAMVLPRLAARHAIDVFVDRGVWQSRAAQAVRDGVGYPAVAEAGGLVRPAHDFQPRHATTPYDLVVYQLGNAACHDYMWPYVFRYPGLLVLHDHQVHHARARTLIAHGRTADYRAELDSCHPGAPAGIADWVIAGVGNMAAYLWPLTNHLVRASRAVAVHYRAVADDLAEIEPGASVVTIRHGAPDLLSTSDAVAASDPGRVVFAAFGLVTPEKRVPQILRALAAIRSVAPGARLKLVGDVASHYDARADAERLGVADLVEITGFVTDADFDRHILSSDVCLCLRWPTNREASGPWLRCLAAGKATVVNDLAHLVEVPTVDPRTWQVLAAPAGGEAALVPPRLQDAVAVSVDILDEDHSLALAMRRLALDGELRAMLGRAARGQWAAHHTLETMAGDYEAALDTAARLPAPAGPATRLPAHLVADGRATAARLAGELGVSVDFLS